MVKVPKRFSKNFLANLKKYQTVIKNHRKKDVSEADTVTVIKDILADVFGYDKFYELTSEQQIRGTFCDLAIKIDSKVRLLIEIKAAGLDLNDHHLRQSVNYGAHEGIDWVVLTNASEWRLYKIKFGKPIDHELVSQFNLLESDFRNEECLQKAYLLAREGMVSDAMTIFHQRLQMFNKFTIAQLVMSEGVLGAVRKELKKTFPTLKVDMQIISDLMANEILKRELVEGEGVHEAQARIKKAKKKQSRLNEKAQDKQLIEAIAATPIV